MRSACKGQRSEHTAQNSLESHARADGCHAVAFASIAGGAHPDVEAPAQVCEGVAQGRRSSGQRGTQIFVVKADSTVETRNVTVVRTVGQESILSGSVEAGEKIIINGQSRVVPGAKVIEKDAAIPDKPTSQSGSLKMLRWKKLA